MRALFAPLIAAVIAATPAAAESSSLAEVSAHLRAVTTMTADFVQTDQKGKTVSGKLSLKQPGRVRFQYQKGVPLLIVGDGSALWMIDYSVRQVSRWPVRDSPLSVLIDPRKDMSRFARIIASPQPGTVAVEARSAKGSSRCRECGSRGTIGTSASAGCTPARWNPHHERLPAKTRNGHDRRSRAALSTTMFSRCSWKPGTTMAAR